MAVTRDGETITLAHEGHTFTITYGSMSGSKDLGFRITNENGELLNNVSFLEEGDLQASAQAAKEAILVEQEELLEQLANFYLGRLKARDGDPTDQVLARDLRRTAYGPAGTQGGEVDFRPGDMLDAISIQAISASGQALLEEQEPGYYSNRLVAALEELPIEAAEQLLEVVSAPAPELGQAAPQQPQAPEVEAAPEVAAPIQSPTLQAEAPQLAAVPLEGAPSVETAVPEPPQAQQAPAVAAAAEPPEPTPETGEPTLVAATFEIPGTNFYLEYDRRVSALGRGTEYGFSIKQEGQPGNLNNLKFDDLDDMQIIQEIYPAMQANMPAIQEWMTDYQAQLIAERDGNDNDPIAWRDASRMLDPVQTSLGDFDGRLGEWLDAQSMMPFMMAVASLPNTVAPTRAERHPDNAGKIDPALRERINAAAGELIGPSESIIAQVTAMGIGEPEPAPEAEPEAEVVAQGPTAEEIAAQTIAALEATAPLEPALPEPPVVAVSTEPELDITSLTSEFMQAAQMFVDGDASNDYLAVQQYESVLVELGMDLTDEQLEQLHTACANGEFMYSADTVRMLAEIKQAQLDAQASGLSPIESLKGMATATFGVISDPASYTLDTAGIDDTKQYEAGYNKQMGEDLKQELFQPVGMTT